VWLKVAHMSRATRPHLTQPICKVSLSRIALAAQRPAQTAGLLLWFRGLRIFFFRSAKGAVTKVFPLAQAPVRG